MNPDLLITVFFGGQVVVLAAAVLILIAREARKRSECGDGNASPPTTPANGVET
jgi:hypothetical protein